MTNSSDFFVWQHRALGWLLAWGAGSVVVGAGLAVGRRPGARQAGLQTLGWGSVDAALALNGRRSARAQLHSGQATHEQAVAREARRFQLITGVNALLDVGYITGGLWWARSGQPRSGRSGVGIAVVLQGLFLLVYDVYLTVAAGRWSRKAWTSAIADDGMRISEERPI